MALDMLEKKVLALVELVQTLKFENAMLLEEKALLIKKLESQEIENKTETKRLESLDKETETVKKTIGDLIQHIDSFIELEQQS